MRKSIILAALAALLLSSCSKGQSESFCGSYSFKTGGFVEVESILLDTTVVRLVAPESGQMHILRESGSNVKVTMNVLAGNPVVYDGIVENGTLILQPQKRKIRLIRDILLPDPFEEVPLTVSGKGARFEDSLIIEMDYEGSCTAVITPGKIVSTSVNCIATRNE